MRILRSENRKLSAWIGSILFHAVLVLLVVFWFSFLPSQKSAPGDERIAIGSIVSLTDSRGQSGEGEGEDESSSDADVSTTVPEKFSTVSLNDLRTTQTLAPGQNVEASAGTESAQDIAGGFLREQGGSGGAGLHNGAATVKFFGNQGTGTKFVYVLDRSLSMEGARLRQAKEELIRSFRSLGDLHQFNIIFYNNDWQQWQPGRKLVHATPAEKENAERYVSMTPAFGGTNHFPPLREAIMLRPDVIFFLTDGESHEDRTLRLPELERLNSQRGYSAQINVIQFGSGGLTDPPSRLLEELATRNRGQYQYVPVATLR